METPLPPVESPIWEPVPIDAESRAFMVEHGKINSTAHYRELGRTVGIRLVICQRSVDLRCEVPVSVWIWEATATIGKGFDGPPVMGFQDLTANLVQERFAFVVRETTRYSCSFLGKVMHLSEDPNARHSNKVGIPDNREARGPD